MQLRVYRVKSHSNQGLFYGKEVSSSTAGMVQLQGRWEKLAGEVGS